MKKVAEADSAALTKESKDMRNESTKKLLARRAAYAAAHSNMCACVSKEVAQIAYDLFGTDRYAYDNSEPYPHNNLDALYMETLLANDYYITHVLLERNVKEEEEDNNYSWTW